MNVYRYKAGLRRRAFICLIAPFVYVLALIEAIRTTSVDVCFDRDDFLPEMHNSIVKAWRDQ